MSCGILIEPVQAPLFTIGVYQSIRIDRRRIERCLRWQLSVAC